LVKKKTRYNFPGRLFFIVQKINPFHPYSFSKNIR